MNILNQDRDDVFVLKKKEELKVVNKYLGILFLGSNVMLNGKLLGTYDSCEDATQVKGEISALFKSGCIFYKMPDVALDLEDLVI